MQHFYALILAGGGGTRLWPLSRKQTPKQILALTEERSMFQVSVDRLSGLFPADQIYVASGLSMTAALQRQALKIPSENFIVEPYARDNAAAVALSMAVIAARDPDAVVALLTADHHIGSPAKFRETLKAANEMAQKGHIVTLGIQPTFPSTGFGYIQRGELLTQSHGMDVYNALGFKEKPNYETAISFLSAGTFSWNSGMFIWSARKAMAEFERQRPETFALLETLKPAIDQPEYDSVLAHVWEQMPRISIDYAIMEKATDVAVIPVDIGWSDVGSWSALYEVLTLDEHGNGIRGDAEKAILVDSTHTLVFGENGGKLTVGIGLDGIVIVDTPDALLVCHRDHAQKIRQVVDHLKATNQTEYL